MVIVVDQIYLLDMVLLHLDLREVYMHNLLLEYHNLFEFLVQYKMVYFLKLNSIESNALVHLYVSI